ncbi:MAG: Fmu (Sun) domain-containing protein, partial [Sediminibacterium sp.]
LALPNASKIDSVLEIDQQVVIQDYNSQRIAEYMSLTVNDLPATPMVWDCCAASGGKSILAVDTFKKTDLTVSDVRISIIKNLEQRFERAGITDYHSFVADLTGKLNIHPGNTEIKFNFIICDAPCSGSGTWGRTPEQLYSFSKERIGEYAALQKKILATVVSYLKKEGYLLYITCSVFKKENEEAVEFILANSKLVLIKQELLGGYDKKADSMFVALFKLRG